MGEVIQFRDRPFAQRIGAMGDAAEGAFETAFPKHHRMGLNRPDFTMSKMTDAMRYTPDYMTALGFVEVMGCASRGDSTLKVKLDKVAALQQWENLGPVSLFIYDSSKKRYWLAPLDEWVAMFHLFGEIHRFNDNNKPYWALHIESFPATPFACEVPNVVAA